jgi:hypothetical protein
MALFTPSESPAITIKEVDLSGVAPNVQSTTGAFVGDFGWGPVEVATLISNENELVSTFSSPDSDNTIDFHSAGYFLKYSGSLQVVREVTSAAENAYDSDESPASDPTIKNRDDFDNQKSALDSDNHTFIAKYPGELGNSLRVEICPVDSDTTIFDAWTYVGQFDAAPGTSTFATGVTATNDEVHVIVVDKNGKFTGTAGTVLERFPYLSVAKNAKTSDGSTNYVKDVINNKSDYVWMAGFGSQTKFDVLAGTDADSGDNFIPASPAIKTFSFASGVNSGSLTPTEYANGFDEFEDVDNITVDFLIAPGMNSRTDQTTVVNDLIAIAGSTRKDCVVAASPARSDIIGGSTPVADAVTTANTFTNSSYLFADNAYLKVYDKYNDQYIHIPAASSTAGVMASSDLSSAPWYSPAGSRRGNYLGVTALTYSPTKANRDTLYKAGVNPVANIPGQGLMLFGDKTHLRRPSAFDRINVRRLFLTLERSIAIAARTVMFEFNDEFTRAEFVNIVEPLLREVKGRRGITDFRVVCDSANNTAAVIDRNEFIADIFIKPARSINYVTLNFVAVRTGVEFSEVVGTV